MSDKPTNDDTGLNETDADRLELLDRIAERLPEINLDKREVSWMTLPDGHPALLVDGGGIDGGEGVYFANAGDDVHAIGPIPTLKSIGAIVIRPDGTRVLAKVTPDPAAKPDEDE
jgi:hypothetical protein